jgi:hypothetical protein
MSFRHIIKVFGVDALMKRFLLALPVALLLTLFGLWCTQAQTPASTSSPTDLSHLLIALRNKATTLESNSTMRVNFESFTSSRKLTPGIIRSFCSASRLDWLLWLFDNRLFDTNASPESSKDLSALSGRLDSSR